MSSKHQVRAWTEWITIPTYLPAAPDRNPMFLEKRVYQGSSGKVYPLPFTDRIGEEAVDRDWKAIWVENEFLRVMVLPEIGGRIHAIEDKTTGADLIYRQQVIKPALVGLAGPWISGGIEFNWPQHHRPATFLPVEVEIERLSDGSRTVWCSDHDPMFRMKGMHGVCLRAGSACVELKVRVFNRTPFVQTFLWWANAGIRVHEGYQSFLPPDVHSIADHAKRATSGYPLCRGVYYGVNYGDRERLGVPEPQCPGRFVPPGSRRSKIAGTNELIPSYRSNDLSYYANIPTPCSYMCVGSRGDFLGGYDHIAQVGLVHVANHHISPGKKQWTWGNHAFGYAWDRNLTDPDDCGEYRPYIELMAGVYTDNQPDFSFLRPGETKVWSQYWYPIQKIGPVQQANPAAAVSLRLNRSKGRSVSMGVAVTREFLNATCALTAKPRFRQGKGASKFRVLARFKRDLMPGAPVLRDVVLPGDVRETDLLVRVVDARGREIIKYAPGPRRSRGVPPPAVEPAPPEEIESVEELFVTGLHLQQYRHATRCPTLYWMEALRRDPLDSRCANAMGLWHMHRGEFVLAKKNFQNAVERLTRLNPNPYESEPFYNLGLCLRHELDGSRGEEDGNVVFEEAYAAFYKAAWSQPWSAASWHALAEMDCRRCDWERALAHLSDALRLDEENTRARNLKVVVLRKLDRALQAGPELRGTLAFDRLDAWARYLGGKTLSCDVQVLLDIAHDYARAGLYAEAISFLRRVALPAARANDNPRSRGQLPTQSWGATPLVFYTLGWLCGRAGDTKSALDCCRQAAKESPDYCFPSRLEEIAVLEAAMQANSVDPRAPYYLGNLLYDRRRHAEAIHLWERSSRLDPNFSVVWRNLGIGYFNVRKQPGKARKAYANALRCNPEDGRLLYEQDQLWKRLGEGPAKRLLELERRFESVARRDDLCVELCSLYNQTGAPEKAKAILCGRKFQPWEGGEGEALAQHVRTHLSLGRRCLRRGEAAAARECFETALQAPENLGEASHCCANQSDIHYWLGVACFEMKDGAAARRHWALAARFKGDFQEMKVRAFSEMTYFSALSMQRLGQKRNATALLKELLTFARALENAGAKIDYFATSLPTMLLFEDDLHFRRRTAALFLRAQAHLGLGHRARAKQLLREVLKRDSSHALAADLLEEWTPFQIAKR